MSEIDTSFDIVSTPPPYKESYVVRIVDEQDLDFPLDAEIKVLLCNCFPDGSEIFHNRRAWHRSPPLFSVLCIADNRVIGHVAVVARTITTTWNFRYRVASLQGVAVVQEHRKSGLSQDLLHLALKESKKRRFLFAILFCKEPLIPYYKSCGWKLAEDNIVMRNEQDLSVSMRSNCPMYRELTQEQFPEGPLDVY